MDPLLLPHPLITPSPFVHPYTKAVFEYVFVQFPYVGGLLTLQFIDILTGFLAAARRGQATSSASWKGMNKKVATWLAILAVIIMSREVPNLPLARPVIVWYMANEFLSMIENLALCGVPMPPYIIKALHALREMRQNNEKTAALGKALNKEGPTVHVHMPEPKVIPVPVPTEQPLVIREIYGEGRTHEQGPDSFEIVDNTQENKEPAKEP